MSDKVYGTLLALGTVAFIYGFASFLIASGNVQSKASWCEHSDGSYEGKSTGNRFEYNPWSLGLDGKCIVPAQKGVTL